MTRPTSLVTKYSLLTKTTNDIDINEFISVEKSVMNTSTTTDNDSNDTADDGVRLCHSQQLIDRIISYGTILLNGVILLVYPVAVLTLLYYWNFARGKFKSEVQELMGLDTGITQVKVVDPLAMSICLTLF